MKCVPIPIQLDVIQADPVFDRELRVYSVDGRCRRSESVCDLGSGPVLAIAERCGVGDNSQVCLEVVEVGLDKAELEGKTLIGVGTAVENPSLGNRSLVDGRSRDIS